MSEAKFKSFCAKAYVPECVAIIETKYPEYNRTLIHQKDKILRRLHLVSFLMNTIKLVSSSEIGTLKRKRDDGSSTSDPPAKRMKGLATEILMEAGNVFAERVRSTPSPVYRGESPDYEMEAGEEYDVRSPASVREDMDDDEIDEGEDIPTNDDDIEDVGFLYEEPEADIEMRFFSPVLLGLDVHSVKGIIESYGIEMPPDFPIFKVDIVDKETRKLIFIIEPEDEEIINELISESSADKFGLVYVNYESALVNSEGCTGLQLNSAKHFLSNRIKELLQIYGKYTVSEEIDSTVIINDAIKGERNDWINTNINASYGPIPTQPSPEKMGMPTELREVTFDDILEGLEDIETTREGLQEACWNGKILPYTVTETVKTSINEDKGMLSLLAGEMGTIVSVESFGKEKDKELLMQVFDSCKKLLISPDVSNFETISISKNRSSTIARNELAVSLIGAEKLSQLLDSVGYEMKGTKSEVGDMKQPTYKTVEKRSYPKWMIELFEDECGILEHPVLTDILFNESEPKHGIDKISVEACERIKSVFCRTACASSISRYMGFSSRMGGAYLINISNENKGHSTIASIPIYHKVKVDGVEQREISGFVIRGPHHVRDATDKINYIQCEQVKPRVPSSMFKKGILITDNNNKKWFICKNAMSRIVPTYGAFMQDLLFLPSNFMGEIIFSGEIEYDNLMERAERLVLENEDFLRHRFTELMIMGMTGTSQEEGYFSVYRMLYMVLLEISRGSFAGLINKSGFFQALNDCVISNCYVLFTHGNLVHTLRFIKNHCITVGERGFVYNNF